MNTKFKINSTDFIQICILSIFVIGNFFDYRLEVYDFNIVDDMPENPYPETTWRDHITSPMGKLAFDATLFNRKEVIDNTEDYLSTILKYCCSSRTNDDEGIDNDKKNNKDKDNKSD